MDIKDYGDVVYSLPDKGCEHSVPNMLNYPHIPACNFELSKMTEQIIKEGRICLTLGGDHSMGKLSLQLCFLYIFLFFVNFVTFILHITIYSFRNICTILLWLW